MMIGYTVPEIRRLLAALTVRAHQPKLVWWWSRWRRRRQHQAPASAITADAATQSTKCRCSIKAPNTIC